jgi:hypothetical protein
MDPEIPLEIVTVSGDVLKLAQESNVISNIPLAD